MRMMQREWQALGHGAPRIDNDRARKAYGMFLPERTRHEVTTTPEVTGEVTAEVTAEVRRLIEVATGEMSRLELRLALALQHDEHFRLAYLKPALEAGLLEMTQPDKPRSSRQRYRLSEAGRRLQFRSKPQAGTGPA